MLGRLGQNGASPRFLAVVGPSGSGKSSVLRAGLVPALKRGDIPGGSSWTVTAMFPRVNPFLELETALRAVATKQQTALLELLQRDAFGLTRAARLILPEERPLLLVIDQFEEIFTLVGDVALARRFMDLIYAAVTDPRSAVRVVITLRADFLDRPLMYPDFSWLIQEHTAMVVPLTPDELERAITLPAQHAHVTIEPGLVARLVAEANEQPGALPLLEFALTELYDNRIGRTITMSTYDEMGGLQRALTSQADRVFAGLSAPQQEATRQLFLRLITLGEGTEDVRRRVPTRELASLDVPAETMNYVTQFLAANRLLTLDLDPAVGEPLVEVAHEALIREWLRLRTWLDESRNDVRMERRLALAADEWQRHGANQDYLMQGARLAQFEGWSAATTVALNAAEHKFLDASIAERDHKRRRRRTLRNVTLASAITVALTMAILALFAFDRERQAQDARAASDANAAEAQDLALVNGAQAALLIGNTDLGLALALEAERSANASPAAHVMLARAAHAPGTMRRIAFPGPVSDVQFSPDGRLAASVSSAVLSVWNVATGELVKELHADGMALSALAFSPNGHMLASGLEDGRLVLWDAETGEAIWEVGAHIAWVERVAFSPDGRTILSGGDDYCMRLWEVERGELVQEGNEPTFDEAAAAQIGGVGTDRLVQEFCGHSFWVMTVAFHPDGRRVLSGSWDGTIRLWDMETGSAVREYGGGLGLVNRVTYSSDGQMILVVSGESADVLVFDAETGNLIRRLRGHDGTTMSVAVSPDGRLALSGAWDSTMILWDIETGEILQRFHGHTDGVTGVAFSPDGRYGLSSSLDGTVRQWDLLGGQVIRRLPPQREIVVRTRFSPDGRQALTSSQDGESVLWDVATGTALRRFNGRNAIFTGGGSTGLFGTGGWYHPLRPGALTLFDLTTGQEIKRLHYPNGVRDLALAPDGKSVAVSFASIAARLVDSTTGEVIRAFPASNNTGVLAISPDGRLLAGNTNQNEVSIWDISTGELRAVFRGHTAILEGLTFSPDGRTLVSSSFDSSIILWDVATGDILRRLTDRSASAFAAAYSPDGKLVVSGAADRTFNVWDAQTGDVLRRYTDLHSGIYSVAFSPDGSQLLVGYIDGTIELWRIDVTEDVVAWAHANRYIRDFTCEERAQYHVAPLCR